jgi:alkylated DNA nucleotide flippase Atl1
MEDYRTRGTPWFTVINADGRIVFSDFHLDADRLVANLESS